MDGGPSRARRTPAVNRGVVVHVGLVTARALRIGSRVGWTMTPTAAGGEHVQPQLGLYVLGALPPVEVAAVEAHLAVCSSCAIEARELTQVRVMLDQLTPEEAAESLGWEGSAPAPARPGRRPA